MKLQKEFTTSERRACRVIDQPRSCQRYVAKPREDEVALVKRMLELARKHPRCHRNRSPALAANALMSALLGPEYSSRLAKKHG